MGILQWCGLDLSLNIPHKHFAFPCTIHPNTLLIYLINFPLESIHQGTAVVKVLVLMYL